MDGMGTLDAVEHTESFRLRGFSPPLPALSGSAVLLAVAVIARTAA
jgi:hypothetical protein